MFSYYFFQIKSSPKRSRHSRTPVRGWDPQHEESSLLLERFQPPFPSVVYVGLAFSSEWTVALSVESCWLS